VDETTVITNVTALVGPELSPVADAVVLLADGRIAEVGRRGDADGGAASTTVDGRRGTLVPGFIDAHVHIGFHPPRAVVAGGVTTVRDLGWPAERIHALADRSRSSRFVGPTILAVGPILTAPGGYPARAPWAPAGTAREIRDADDAEHAVEACARRGACAVKVALDPTAGPTLDDRLLEVVVRASHRRGLRVTAHVHGLRELEKALDAGVDELAHMLMSEERLPDEIIERMVALAVTVVPTLSIRFGDDLALAAANLRRFVAAGGRFIYGTDLGNSGPRPGIDAREIAGLASAGLGPRRIIASATVESADYLGLRSVGRIEAGMDADIVVLGGHALSDVGALPRVRMTWRRGVRVR
jgi:imidazolonepropionase-like amidohydrolase